DRVFLLRQGNDRPGIVGSGTVASPVDRVPNWEGAGSRPGIEVAWDHLFDPDLVPPLPRSILPINKGTRPIWFSQTSGVRIPDNLVPEIERLWQAHIEGYRSLV